MASTAIRGAKASIQSSTHYQTGKELGNELFADLGDAVFGDVDADGMALAEAEIMNTVRVILGAMIGLAVGIVVLNEVFSLNSVSNSSGPFSEVITQIENIGGAALGLIVIGLLVAAANQIMSFFGGGGF